MNSVSPSPSFVYSQSLNRNAMWGQKSRNKNQELLLKSLGCALVGLESLRILKFDKTF